MKILGVDPGTNTGVALWDTSTQRFEFVRCMAVHRALDLVGQYLPAIPVIFEDARQRQWFGNTGREVLQGAGAAKRDAKIWEDFLEDKGAVYIARAPASGSTGWNVEKFQRLTHWTERTNEHGRDAGVLVFGFRDHEIASVRRSWEQTRANKATYASARR